MNNYIQFPTELFEAFMKAKLPATHISVCLAIIRKTYGWHKEEDMISLSQFKELTGLARSYICAEIIPKLLEKRIIKRTSKGKSYMYKVNEDITEWAVDFRVKPELNTAPY